MLWAALPPTRLEQAQLIIWKRVKEKINEKA